MYEIAWLIICINLIQRCIRLGSNITADKNVSRKEPK